MDDGLSPPHREPAVGLLEPHMDPAPFVAQLVPGDEVVGGFQAQVGPGLPQPGDDLGGTSRGGGVSLRGAEGEGAQGQDGEEDGED